MEILSVTPASDTASGGVRVALSGSGFPNATAVTIGGVPVVDFAVISDTLITGTAPPQASAGTVLLTVTDSIGASARPASMAP